MKERIITALCVLLIVMPLLIIGGLPYKILIIVISSIALYELMKARYKYPIIMKLVAYTYLGAIIYRNIDDIYYHLDNPVIISSFMAFLLPTIFFQPSGKYTIKDAFYLLSSVLFLGTSFSFFILIRNVNLYLFLYLVVMASITDTFAYFIGKFFGKHHLAPSISPKKTWEGSIAGTIFGVVIGTLFYMYLVDGSKNIYLVILMSFLLSIIGQLGDLVFSAIKREYKIKDFSKLMPGHGGILDRVDSLILIVMAYALFHLTI